MFTTQWVDGKKKNVDNNPVCISWKESDNPNNIISDHISVISIPTDSCNYRCIYCCNYYPIDNEERSIHNDEINKEKWFYFMESLSRQYKLVQYQFIGGEPLMYPDISELIRKAISLEFKCSIVSNFSSSKQLDKILEIGNPELLTFSCSLHPLNKAFNINNCIKYLSILKERGYRIRATMISWPDNIPYYKEWKPIFKDLDIPLWLKYCGGYNLGEIDKNYLFQEGTYKTTAKYLKEIGWI